MASIVDKQFIIDEIKRVVSENGGSPVGRERFRALTGIKQGDWYGRYWAAWGDALKEAGYETNDFQQAIDESIIIEHLIALLRELGKFPVDGEIRLKATRDQAFPCHTTIRKRLGKKNECARKILEYCCSREGYEDVVQLCEPIIAKAGRAEPQDGKVLAVKYGFVYLMKSGDFYKIGRSDAPGRREYDLGSQRPEGIERVHAIRTDDPQGIEAYWHNRFRKKRKRGEWFALTREDIELFKRWKRIY